MTSRQAVDKVKQVLRRLEVPEQKKVKLGHAGTLDPLANGVLVVAIGPATRLIPFLQRSPKSYRARFRLGVTSETLDLESKLTAIDVDERPSRDDLENAIGKFVGAIQQVPPEFSAAKVGGRRAYKLARRGTEVKLSPRTVHVYAIKLNEFDYPEFELEIECGTGTYIRSLGRDIGRSLNSGAVMTELCRTSIGCFRLEEAVDVSELDAETVHERLVDPSAVLDGLPTYELSEQEVGYVRNGTKLPLEQTLGEEIAAKDSHGRLMAILRLSGDGLYRPFINFVGYHDEQSAIA